MLIDTHAHLDSLDDVPGILARARENGIEKIIAISSDLASSRDTVSISEEYENVFAAVGVHPHAAKTADGGVLAEIEKLAGADKVVAVGETGLDYHYMNSGKEAQISSLTAHIGISRRANLPIVIHVRDADPDLLDILRTEKVSERTGVIHCFTGNYETARKYLDLGFYISFSGIATFRKSEEIRDAAKKIPGDRLLIETDSPYLAPVPLRGKPNEPAYVKYVAEAIADTRGVSVEEIAELTSENAVRLFGLGR
ncbi:MAG: TatD family hydrolase [Thermodesulfobacteriota bacterium]